MIARKRLLLLAVFVLCCLPPLPVLAVTVEDSRGTHTFSQPPQRVVALSWAMAEQLLDLAITPVGIADVDGYRTWVVNPPLPEGVADLGLRQEPNFERIAELAPELILISDDQLSFAEQLQAIAPVLHFDAFSADHNNWAAAQEIYLELAGLFQREDLARERLAEQARRLEALAERLDRHFAGHPPPVTVVRFLDQARVAVYGGNAMTSYALGALGLDNGYPLPDSTWGLNLKKIQDLGRISRGHVLHIQPFFQAQEVFARPLWQAMPFVRAGRFHALPPVWTYGGALSVGRLAEEIARVLLAVKPG
ncbi:MAG: ABC transporter substrate-binding protein [Candidatus Competibacteraceae bacterium]|nr:ABC transporter substrate-binding protein [Candidatus Competibacteraceae bacterium]